VRSNESDALISEETTQRLLECGVGTLLVLLLLFAVVALIKKKKKEGQSHCLVH
jgi:hypothetical protein